MSTGKTLLALALSALLPAGAAFAAINTDTIIYCSEASPESFNPQIASSGPSFVASSQVLYNRLIRFRSGKKYAGAVAGDRLERFPRTGKHEHVYAASGREIQQQ